MGPHTAGRLVRLTLGLGSDTSKAVYSACIRRWLSVGLVVAVAAAVGACGTDAVTLPSDFHDKKVKQLLVTANVEQGTFQNLAGLQGGPLPTTGSGSVLLEQMLQVSADAIRVPQGYLCDYTLSGVFPDTLADPADPTAYEFGVIDNVMTAMHRPDTGEPYFRIIYQATFDIGNETCTIDNDGIQSSARPKDPDRWAQAVVGVLRHFNGGLLDATSPTHQPWLSSARPFHVRDVEFIDAPLTRGGYESAKAVADDFIILADAIKGEFPGEDAAGVATVRVIGPSMLIESADGIAQHPIVGFLDELLAQGKEPLLDALSFQTAVRHPSENVAIAKALRKVLDERGLTSVELWATRYEPSRVANPEPVDDTGTAAWSNFSGAFTNATRIGWQGVVDLAVFYRGDRRHRSKDGSDVTLIEESPLWDKTGAFRPAGYGWLAFRKMGGLKRVQVVSENPDDDEGLALVAAFDADGCPDQPGTCPTLYVLIANTNSHLGQFEISYRIDMTGLADGSSGSRDVVVSRWILDASVGQIKFDKEDDLTMVDGKLFYQFESSVPGCEFIQVELK